MESSPAKAQKQRRLLVLVAISFLSGLIGGFIGVFGVNNYLSLNRDRSRQVVLEESSAIIDVSKTLAPSVVSIVTESSGVDIFGRPNSSEAAGSGIVIKSDGLILTNKHVVPEGSTNIKIVFNDGKEISGAQVLARDPFNDIAYLRVQATDLKPASLADSDQVVVGQRVIAIGNALGEYQNTVTSGIISGIGRPVTAQDSSSEAERLQDLLQTDAAINPGNSGGPLVNVQGQVVGINTAVAEAENIGFAIPINQAKAGIASIEKSGELKKPYLGVRYVPLTRDIARQNDLPVNEGAYIVSESNQPAILPDSPAAKAGLQERDIITKINGESITENRSLVTLIGKYQVGDKVKLTILRNNESKEIELTLEQIKS
jgi:serine protease Do